MRRGWKLVLPKGKLIELVWVQGLGLGLSDRNADYIILQWTFLGLS